MSTNNQTVTAQTAMAKRIALSMGVSRQDCDDVVQSAMARLYLGKPSKGNIDARLMTLVRSEVSNLRTVQDRRAAMESIDLDTVTSTLSGLPNPEEVAIIRETVAPHISELRGLAAKERTTSKDRMRLVRTKAA